MTQEFRGFSPDPDDTPAASATPPPFSALAIFSVIFGVLAFVPLIGVLFGLLALVLGLIGVARIREGVARGMGLAATGCILGTLGIGATVAIYAYVFKEFRSNTGMFAQVKRDGTQQMLMQNAGQLELYKKKFGRYPQTLREATREGYQLHPMDFYQQELVYRPSEDGAAYELSSVGPDGKKRTADDILPKK